MSTDVSSGSDRPPKPDPPDVTFGAVPSTLTERDQWLLWRYKWKPDQEKWDKVPVNPKRGHRDSATDSDVWVSFEEVKEAYHADHINCDGIGFAFSEDDGIVGIDLDNCRDKDSGQTEAWAVDIVSKLDSWTEVSPSGTGFHVFVVADLPDGGNRSGDVEMYDSGRYFTVTGDHVDVTPTDLKERNGELAEVHSDHITDDADTGDTTVVTSDHTGDVDLTDQQLIEKAKNADNGPKFKRLYNGNTAGYPSHSEADEALCSLLAFWTRKDKQRIDRLFQESGLYREKWDEDRGGQTYGEMTIQGAIDTVDEVYDPSEAVSSPPEPKGLTDEDGNSVPEDTRDILTPREFQVEAGLGEDDSIFDLNDKQKAATVWRLIKRSNQYHVRCDRENGTIWAYDDGIWKPDGERSLRFACRKALSAEHYGSNVLNELKTQARADPYVEIERDSLGVGVGKVAVENGLVDLQKAADGDSGALRPLEPEDHALTRLPVSYDPDADYSLWNDFVSDVVEDDKVEAVQEYVGYCLHRGEMPFHRALLLVGTGSNGKSTFLNVVSELLGPENTESKPVHQFDQENVVADLYGKIANIDADLSEGSLSKRGVAMFKRLVGNDRVSARRLYEDAFTFKPTAKHLYACNKVPDVSTLVNDTDTAFWRRWVIVEFPKYFPPQDRDPTLEDRLTSDESLSGVLNWAIEGYQRLMEQGHFSNIETTADEIRRLWQSWGESVDEFIVACLERDEDADNISTNALYEVYREWCRVEGKHRMKQQTLTNTVKNDGTDFGYKTSVRTIDKRNPINGYTACGFTDDAPSLEEVLSDSDDDSDDEDDDTRPSGLGDYQ